MHAVPSYELLNVSLMENEYHERKPESNLGREALEGLQNKNKASKKPIAPAPPTGNEYHEKPASVDAVGTRSNASNTAEKADGKKPADKKEKKAPRRANLLVQVLNGDILTRDVVLNNLTFVFFILFLLLLVVGKGYYGKQLTKDIDTLQTDVNANTAEYIENKARLEELTTRYRLVEALERRGLKEAVKPVKVIRIKTKKQ